MAKNWQDDTLPVRELLPYTSLPWGVVKVLKVAMVNYACTDIKKKLSLLEKDHQTVCNSLDSKILYQIQISVFEMEKSSCCDGKYLKYFKLLVNR